MKHVVASLNESDARKFLADRKYNYWFSAIVEKMALAPKSKARKRRKK